MSLNSDTIFEVSNSPYKRGSIGRVDPRDFSPPRRQTDFCLSLDDFLYRDIIAAELATALPSTQACVQPGFLSLK